MLNNLNISVISRNHEYMHWEYLKDYEPVPYIISGQSQETEVDSLLRRAIDRFSDPELRQPTCDAVKGTLLTVADSMLATLSELVIERAQYEEGLSKMQPAELELVVQCKLAISAVAQQRHHSALAARIVLSAMRMLQNAEIFKEKRAHLQAEARRWVSTIRTPC